MDQFRVSVNKIQSKQASSPEQLKALETIVVDHPCIYRIKLASCTENFRQVAGENLPPRRKGPPVMGSASRSGWQSVGSVIVVGNRDAILGQNSLQQLSAFQVKV